WSTEAEVARLPTTSWKVLPSNLAPRDFSNIYPDSDIVDVSLYSGMPVSLQWTSAAVPNRNYIRASETTEAGSFSTPAWPIEAGASYFFSASIGRQGGQVGANITASLFVEWYSDHAVTTLIEAVQIGADFTGLGFAARSAILSAPGNAVRARFRLDKTEDLGTRLALTAPIVRRAPEM